MAIHYYVLKFLAPRLKGADVLSLGYPELLLEDGKAEELFSVKPHVYRNEKLSRRHGLNYALPETVDLLSRVCKSFRCVDYVRAEGVEELADLNYPQTLGQYDVVIDPGTLEHCFNVGQALVNAAQAVRPGGIVVHMNPSTMMNHGFWNFCPTLYADFYTQNGWEVERLEFVRFEPGKAFSADVRLKAWQRCKVEPEFGILCVAKRLKPGEMKYPVQRKYIELYNHKAAA